MLIITSFPFLLSGSDKLKSGTSFENPKMWNCHISPPVAQEAATEKKHICERLSIRTVWTEPMWVCLSAQWTEPPAAPLSYSELSSCSDLHSVWRIWTAVEASQLDPEVSTKVLLRLFCERQHISSLDHKVSGLLLLPYSSCCDRTVQTRHKTRTPHISQPEQPTQPKETTRSLLHAWRVAQRREADVTGSDPDVCQVSGN